MLEKYIAISEAAFQIRLHNGRFSSEVVPDVLALNVFSEMINKFGPTSKYLYTSLLNSYFSSAKDEIRIMPSFELIPMSPKTARQLGCLDNHPEMDIEKASLSPLVRCIKKAAPDLFLKGGFKLNDKKNALSKIILSIYTLPGYNYDEFTNCAKKVKSRALSVYLRSYIKSCEH
ncbi:MAG: hypothetical protein HRT44_03585 [Bdellovibrionales bacterium]|nr:hypothetical protein [Bdellovibrionales bacterium]